MKKEKAGKRGRKKNVAILSYRSWVIESTSTCIVLRKRGEVKDSNARYYPDIKGALNGLFEILLQKNAKSGKGAKTLGSLRNSILETRKEFEEILSLPRFEIENFGGETRS